MNVVLAPKNVQQLDEIFECLPLSSQAQGLVGHKVRFITIIPESGQDHSRKHVHFNSVLKHQLHKLSHY